VNADGITYQNGAMTSVTLPVFSNTSQTEIGKTSATTYYNGSIDEVMIFNRSLSQAEITNIYNLNRIDYNGSTDNLVAYYEFDGTPNDFTDSIGTNDGTGYGDVETEIINGSENNIEVLMNITNDGDNMVFDTQDGVGYFTGQVSATEYITRTYSTKKSDEEAYKLVQYANENFNADEKNYHVWGECAVKGKGSKTTNKWFDTCSNYNNETFECEGWDNVLIKITRPNYIGINLECKQTMIMKAFEWQTHTYNIEDGLTSYNGSVLAGNYLTDSPTDKRSDEEKKQELDNLLTKELRNKTSGKLEEVPEQAKPNTEKASWSVSGLVDWVYENVIRQEKKIRELEDEINDLEIRLEKLEKEK
jgi:hypothetical protein